MTICRCGHKRSAHFIDGDACSANRCPCSGWRKAGVTYAKQRLLLRAAESIRGTFCIGELAVAAWRLFPEDFRIDGITENFPDTRKVQSSVYGKRGLLEKGLLAKDGEKFFVPVSASPSNLRPPTPHQKGEPTLK